MPPPNVVILPRWRLTVRTRLMPVRSCCWSVRLRDSCWCEFDARRCNCVEVALTRTEDANPCGGDRRCSPNRARRLWESARLGVSRCKPGATRASRGRLRHRSTVRSPERDSANLVRVSRSLTVGASKESQAQSQPHAAARRGTLQFAIRRKVWRSSWS